MPARAGLLLPRGRAPGYRDLAERDRLIRAQRLPSGAPKLRARRRARVATFVKGLGVALGLAAVGILAWQAGRFLLTDARFTVAEVRVAGLSRLSEAAIREAAGLEEQNLFRLDVAGARARLEALPGVERAHVIREWPNRIAIVVREREPFALVNAGGLHWVDAEGVVLGPLPALVVPPGPILSGVEVERMQPGARLPSDRLAQGLQFLRELHRGQAPLAEALSEVNLAQPDGLVLYTMDGIEVRLGSERWEERLARLEALLGNLSESVGAPIGSIDLRFRDLVVLKPRGGRS